MAVFRFFKMAAVRHLEFVIRLFGTTTKCILLVFVTVQNLCLNRCSSFGDMQVLIFLSAKLQNAYLRPLGDVLGYNWENRKLFCSFIALAMQLPGIDIL